MSEIKIQMQNNKGEIIHPETNANIVKYGDKSTAETLGELEARDRLFIQTSEPVEDGLWLDTTGSSNDENGENLVLSEVKKYVNSLKTELNEKVKKYIAVQNMKNDTNLQVDDIVYVSGYYDSLDGGQGHYKIISDTTSTDDGGSIILLNNGLKAKAIFTNDEVNVKRFGAKGDGTTDDSTYFQKCLDYITNTNLVMFVPNGTFIINTPLILKNNYTYNIKGINPCIDTGTAVNKKSILKPSGILFKGELTNDNTTVYMTVKQLRIFFQQGEDGYTKTGTMVFSDLNLFGTLFEGNTIRYVDIFCKGYVSKVSRFTNNHISFIKTALFSGNSYNGAFMADSQVDNCYITGAYPVTLLHGIAVNTNFNHNFFDFFKCMQNYKVGSSSYCDNLKFEHNTIGMFFKWFETNACRGHVEILNNKIEAVSQSDIQKYKNTNFVNIDSDMESGTYGVFLATSWQDNIYNNPDSKCRVFDNIFKNCDNIFTRANSISQVHTRGNMHYNIKGSTFDFSYRVYSTGEYASFICEELNDKIHTSLPLVIDSGNKLFYEGQRIYYNNKLLTLIDSKWVDVTGTVVI